MGKMSGAIGAEVAEWLKATHREGWPQSKPSLTCLSAFSPWLPSQG